MIILPIGHEQDGTRRLPWVTFGVMILCGLAFFATDRADLFAEDDMEMTKDFMEALDYYFEHPYLELDPKFQELVFPGGSDEEMREAYSEFFRALPTEPAGGGLRSAEQQVLDKLVDKALGSYGDHPFMRWGLVPDKKSPITFITHMFLHAGWLHLLGNLLILYLAGPFIEDVWGRPIYAAFYVLSGLVAAVSFIVVNPSSEIPMVGASGAIAGVMGAFLVRYRTTQLQFFYMFGFFWRGTFSAPAWVMLPLWFGQQVFMYMLTKNLGDDAGGGVAYMAHIGGFVFGLAVALVMQHQRIEERFVASKIEGKVNKTLVDNSAVEQALEAQAHGEPERAFEILCAESRRSPTNHDAALACWSVAVELDRTAEAAPALLRSIDHELRSGDPDLALEHWLELNERVPGLQVEPALLVRIAKSLAEINQHGEALIALRRALLGAGRSANPALALKIAQAGKHLDAQLARGAVKLALSRPGLDPAVRAQAERLLEELSAEVQPATVAGP
jgi:membrane associated rhomboid family serine protease